MDIEESSSSSRNSSDWSDGEESSFGSGEEGGDHNMLEIAEDFELGFNNRKQRLLRSLTEDDMFEEYENRMDFIWFMMLTEEQASRDPQFVEQVFEMLHQNEKTVRNCVLEYFTDEAELWAEQHTAPNLSRFLRDLPKALETLVIYLSFYDSFLDYLPGDAIAADRRNSSLNSISFLLSAEDDEYDEERPLINSQQSLQSLLALCKHIPKQYYHGIRMSAGALEDEDTDLDPDPKPYESDCTHLDLIECDFADWDRLLHPTTTFPKLVSLKVELGGCSSEISNTPESCRSVFEQIFVSALNSTITKIEYEPWDISDEFDTYDLCDALFTEMVHVKRHLSNLTELKLGRVVNDAQLVERLYELLTTPPYRDSSLKKLALSGYLGPAWAPALSTLDQLDHVSLSMTDTECPHRQGQYVQFLNLYLPKMPRLEHLYLYNIPSSNILEKIRYDRVESLSLEFSRLDDQILLFPAKSNLTDRPIVRRLRFHLLHIQNPQELIGSAITCLEDSLRHVNLEHMSFTDETADKLEAVFGQKSPLLSCEIDFIPAHRTPQNNGKIARLKSIIKARCLLNRAVQYSAGERSPKSRAFVISTVLAQCQGSLGHDGIFSVLQENEWDIIGDLGSTTDQ